MTISENPFSSGSYTFPIVALGQSDDRRFYDEHPEKIKNIIDGIAGDVLDPDGGRVFVIGFESVGKSFLIEQFASNVDQYLEYTNLDSLHVLSVSRNDSNLICSVPNGVNSYIDSCAASLSCQRENICYVTENPDFAAMLNASDPSMKVILEVSPSTYAQLRHGEEQGVTKLWSSWGSVDANFVFLHFNDLVETLENIMVPKFKEYNRVSLQDGEIAELVEFFIEKNEELIHHSENSETDEDEDFEENYEDGVIMVPPGLWGLAVRQLSTSMSFSHKELLKDESGNTSLEKVIDEVYEQFGNEFGKFAETFSNGDEPEESMIIMLPGSDGQPHAFRMSNAEGGLVETQTQTEDVANETLVFSDTSTLATRLKKTVFGQDPVVSTVVDSILVPAAGLNGEDKPVRSFLFLGPTGVGKTQMALSLAQEVAEEPMSVIRLDMSEYAQPHEASKLFGSPSGYVGHDEGGVLTNHVKQNPHSLILLDEVEKAHHKIWDSFLQVLDSGRMTDNKGTVVDFSQCIIVMTSNLGSEEVAKGINLGFSNSGDDTKKISQSIMRAVEGFFRIEFIGRIDDIVIFNKLSHDTARYIVRREIEFVSDRMKPRGFALTKPKDDVIDEIIGLSSFEKFGARDIQKAVFKNVSQQLASRMLSNKKKTKTIKMILDDDKKIKIN